MYHVIKNQFRIFSQDSRAEVYSEKGGIANGYEGRGAEESECDLGESTRKEDDGNREEERCLLNALTDN
uniref:Uncharacterized protein n=1 Tax=Caenorhabditis tropicalis TaxID=1561998 RepID=A0A1I7U5L0_9PELO